MSKFDFTNWVVKDEQGKYGKQDRWIYLQNTITGKREYPKYTWVGDQLTYYKDTTEVPDVLKEFIVRTFKKTARAKEEFYNFIRDLK